MGGASRSVLEGRLKGFILPQAGLLLGISGSGMSVFSGGAPPPPPPTTPGQLDHIAALKNKMRDNSVSFSSDRSDADLQMGGGAGRGGGVEDNGTALMSGLCWVHPSAGPLTEPTEEDGNRAINGKRGPAGP